MDIMKIVKKSSRSSHEYLPLELIIEILTRLPVKSLIRFKCVSKTWYELINNDDHLIKLHLSRSDTTLIFSASETNPKIYSFTYHQSDYVHVSQVFYPTEEFPNPGKIVGSCNGLLCFEPNPDRRDDSILLHNPATRVYKKLPPPLITFNGKEKDTDKVGNLIMFGYDCVSDDYKVLQLTILFKYDGFVEKIDQKYTVYSLKTNAWEIIRNPPWEVTDRDLCNTSGVLVNNSLHWIIPGCKQIKCFDLFTHKFYELSLPTTTPTMNQFSVKLMSVKGELCMMTRCIDIWIMKEYGVEKSWSRLFRSLWMQVDYCYLTDMWPELNVGCLIDGRNITLVFSYPGYPYCKFVICCDTQTKQAIKIIFKDVPAEFGLNFYDNVLPWVESLVSLY